MGVLVEDVESCPVHGLELMGAGDLNHLGGLGEPVAVGFLKHRAAHGESLRDVTQVSSHVPKPRPFSHNPPPLLSQQTARLVTLSARLVTTALFLSLFFNGLQLLNLNL